MKKKFSLRSLPAYFNTHYHWVVAFVAVMMTFVGIGAANNLFSLHVIPVSEYLGIERATFSLAFSGRTLLNMLVTFFSGFIISKFGSRVCITAGLIGAGLGYTVLAFTSHWSMLVLGGCLLGISTSFFSTAGACQIVRVWFHRHEGTVLGIVTAASGIGGSVMCILQTAAMEAGSFRSSYGLCAALLFLMALAVFLFIRNTPQEKGLLPLGDGEEIVGKRRKIADNAFPGLPMDRLMRRPSFYLMILCVFLSAFSVYMAFSIILPFLVDCGFSATVASGLSSMMMLVLTGTKFFTGVLCDRIGARKTNLLCSFFCVVSLSLLALISDLPSAILAILLYTLALPLVTIMTPLISYSLFGYRAQAKYTGVFMGIICASNFSAEYTTNLIFDFTRSYRTSFWVAAATAALALLLYLVLYPLADRDKKIAEEKQ